MSPQKEHIREQLSAYLDGEADDSQARRLERAMADDPALAGELERLRAVRSLLRELPKARAPAGLAERVIERAERGRLLEAPRPPAGRPVAWWLGRLAAAAMVLIALGVGVLVIARLGAPTEIDDAPVELAMKDDARAAPATAARDARRAGGEPPMGKSGEAPVVGRSVAEPYLANSVIVETPDVHFFIPTDNLVLAQRQMADELDRNDLVAVDGKRADTEPAPAKVRVSKARVPDHAQAGANRVDFDVVVDETELRKIVSAVNAVRTRQNVAQIPLRDVPFMQTTGGRSIDLAAADAFRDTGSAMARSMQGKVGVAAEAVTPPAGPSQTVAAETGPSRETEVAIAQRAKAADKPADRADKDWQDNFWNVRFPAAAGQQRVAQAQGVPAAEPPAQVFNYQSRQIVRIIASQRGQTTQFALATQQAVQTAANFRRLRIVLLRPPEAVPQAAPSAKH